MGQDAATHEVAGERPCALVDTHAHLHWPSLADDAAAVLDRARAVHVSRILTLGTELASSRAAVALSEQHPGIYAAAGIHPSDVPAHPGRALEEIEPLFAHPRVVAIGETGLDYYHEDNPPREAQVESFIAHLDLATRTGKPVCVHNRDASDDVLGLLEQYAGRVTAVLHCYTGDLDTARHAVSLGCYISFAGNVTYPKLRALLDVAAEIPADRLLVETDSPFLAPQPRRGRRNEPANIVYTYDAVARARDMSRSELAALVSTNAGRLFHWNEDVAA